MVLVLYGLRALWEWGSKDF